MVINKKLLILSSCLLLVVPTIIFAQTFESFFCIIMNTAVNVVEIVAGGFVVIMFAVAGMKFLTAQGNAGKVDEARQAVIWGLIGVVVIIFAGGANGFIQLVSTQLGGGSWYSCGGFF